MKTKMLKKIYEDIRSDLNRTDMGFDSRSSMLACTAFDRLSFQEKKEICEEIKSIAPKAGTNSNHYGNAAYVANLLQFYAETWQNNEA